MSHVNDDKFYDMIEVIKGNQNQGQKVICYAGHFNSRKLYNKLRNLTDNQILTLKEVGGFIGVFSNKNFVSNDNFKKKYLEHIIHISNLIGVDNIMLSTDDMRFMGDYDKYYLESYIFDYSNITNEVKTLLMKYFSIDDTNKIMLLNYYNKINSFFVSLLASICGILLGRYFIGAVFLGLEMSFFEVPNGVPIINNSSYVVVALVIIVVSFITYLICYKSLCKNPVDTLRT